MHRYHLHIRPTIINHLIRCGKLSQQFFLDAFVKAEELRLHYVETHQKELKAAKYNIVIDSSFAGDLDNMAHKVILPPTVTGTPRYFTKAYQDCMAIVR